MSHESGDGSVTRLIAALRESDQDAAAEVWNRYFQRLVEVARRRIGGAARRVSDEEDVALSVLDSLCAGAAQGRFPQLADRNDLWKLLIAITRQKVVDNFRRATSQKRGGGDVRGDSVMGTDDDSLPAGFDRFPSDTPTPEFLAQLQEEHARLLQTLPDDTFRQLALLKMESYTNEEIAAKLGLSTSTVERKLKRVRDCWIEAAP